MSSPDETEVFDLDATILELRVVTMKALVAQIQAKPTAALLKTSADLLRAVGAVSREHVPEAASTAPAPPPHVVADLDTERADMPNEEEVEYWRYYREAKARGSRIASPTEDPALYEVLFHCDLDSDSLCESPDSPPASQVNSDELPALASEDENW